MKILITGVNGFIGKYLSQKFGNDCIPTTRETLDLSKKESVTDFFLKHDSFDAIIHCAIKGGKRTIQYGPEILYENLLAFENLIKYADKTKIFVSYSSGAEFLTEDNHPYYGMSKHIISHRLKEYKNAINIRIYNCFGKTEDSKRFITTCIRNCLQNKNITIFQNKYMDFFYVEDLYTLTNYVISNKKYFDVIDAVYSKKITLEDVAKYIKNVTNSTSKIIIEREGLDIPYIGDGTLLESLHLPLVGFQNSINTIINYMKNEVS